MKEGKSTLQVTEIRVIEKLIVVKYYFIVFFEVSI
jgi:hypothetical protein